MYSLGRACLSRYFPPLLRPPIPALTSSRLTPRPRPLLLTPSRLTPRPRPLLLITPASAARARRDESEED